VTTWRGPLLAKLRGLAAAGLSRAHAAREIGVAKQRIDYLAYKHHIAFKRPRRLSVGRSIIIDDDLVTAMASARDDAREDLHRQIAAARTEAATAPPYKGAAGWL
jgi:hypothetical protein